MALVSVVEASRLLGVSTHTIKRHLKQGKLQGQQQETPQGYVWLVEIADDYPAAANAVSGQVAHLEEMMHLLQQQVEYQQRQMEGYEHELEARRREVQELHVLLQQAQAALPAPKDHRSWWRFWQR